MTTLQKAVTVPFATGLARHGNRLAVLHDGVRMTYRDLAERVESFADLLGPTRRLVLVAAQNDVASLVAYLGALAGGHPVILVPGDRSAAFDPVVAAYQPDVVVRSRDGEPVLDERHPGTRHDLHPDLALLLSTSGSTGSPKLVRLSHSNVQANAEAIAESLGIRVDDRAATTLPLQYCYGLSVINTHLLRGASLVLTDLSVVDPCFWDLFRSSGATAFAAVPYTFELLDRVGFAEMDLPTLRYVTQAGGRLAPDTVRRYAETGSRRGWDLVVMYGQTEATARMAYLPPELAAEHPEAVGIAVPGGSFRIESVPDSEHGELVYSGPNVMLGYAEGPDDLARGPALAELRTGDLARVNSAGLVEVVGRRSRFVKVVGLRVDLARVERNLAELGLEAIAAGVDERLVVAVEGVNDPGLVGKVLAGDLGLPRAAVVVHGVAQLPRLASGKPDVVAVVDLDRRETAAAVTRPLDHGPADVRRIFAEELGQAGVTGDSTFVGLGGDSLSYVATSVRLEAALGHLPADWHVTPLRDLLPRTQAPRRWSRLASPLETSILLRAVAIVLIVGTHAQLFSWPGTAHVLIAVAGFNFARFQLVGDRTDRVARQLRSIARIVAPSVALIGVAYLVTDTYSVANVVLLNALVGPPTWTTQWHFWFVEVVVYLLVVMAALLSVPWVDRAERRFPLGLPVLLAGIGLLSRYDLVDLAVPRTQPVLWLFALGWVVARVRSTTHRLGVSVVAVLTVPGFFADPRREAVVLVGLLLLTWLPTVPVPERLHRLLGVLASASLYVYLTHWLVYPAFVAIHPAVAVVASLGAGIGYWALVGWVPTLVRRRALGRPRTLDTQGLDTEAVTEAARAGARAALARSPKVEVDEEELALTLAHLLPGLTGVMPDEQVDELTEALTGEQGRRGRG